MPPGTTVHNLECLAYTTLARLYWLLAGHLSTQREPLPEIGVAWNGRKSSRRSYAEMCDIHPDISKDELDRRVHAFGGDYFGISHTIKLHGYTFRLVKADATSEGVAPDQARAAFPAAASSERFTLRAVG
jgi:hypothetical protein